MCADQKTATRSPFKLKRPCAKCPFRTDVPGGGAFIRRDRAVEIAQALANGSTFHCHSTVDYTAEDLDGNTMPNTSDSEFCAGAMIMLEKTDQPNQMMRIGERLGSYDPSALDMDAPVVDSPHEFIRHHSDEGEIEEDGEREPCSVANAGCEAPAGYADGSPGHGHAEHACYQCGQPVCEACSEVQDDSTNRLCDYCADS